MDFRVFRLVEASADISPVVSATCPVQMLIDLAIGRWVLEDQIACNNRAIRETFILEIERGTNNPWLMNGVVDHECEGSNV